MINTKATALIFIAISSISFFTFNYLDEKNSYEYVSQTGHLDHIVLATYNIDVGMQQFEQMTGVRPIFGGKHKSGYTQNAIVSLGDDLYIEILAPQDTEKARSGMKHFDKYQQITPLGWAINTDNIQTTHNNLKSFGYKTGKVKTSSRAEPGKATVVWHSVKIKEEIQQKPMMIQWDDMALHPAKSQEAVCSLESFGLANPESEDLKKLVSQLNIDGLNIKQADNTSISLSLSCPTGTVNF